MALEGTLQDMSMSDLFQIFRLGPKSGVLLLEKDVYRSVIYVDRGKLIDAFVVRGEERTVVATGDEAVLHTLVWDDARFVFRHDLSVAGRQARIEHDSEWLVMESMRRRTDPLRAVPYQQITLDTVLQLSPLPTNAESSVSLDVDQWRILSHAANNQSLRAICKATSIEQEKALRIVAELLSIGLVEIVPQMPTRPSGTHRRASSPLDPSSSSASSHTPAADSMNASNATHAHNVAHETRQPTVGRSLLNAIMRRINDL
jgi:hypothetical protein